MSYSMISILLIGSLRSPPPYPATPDFPRRRGQNKTPRNTFFINGSTVSTGYSSTVEVLHRTSKWGEVRRLACPLRRFPFAAPPNYGGKVVAPATKGGMHFLARRAVVWFSDGRKPGCEGFIQTGAFYKLEAPTTTFAPKGETTHYDLCVALLLQIMFAVHARGASNLSPLRTFGPRVADCPIGR